MKRHYIFILLLAGMFASCKRSNIEYENSFEKSYNSWLNFRQSSNNSYRYQVSSGSWTGIGSETIIAVEWGKVVRRSFILKKPANDGTNNIVILEEWDEDEGQLNTHSHGAATLTLGEIYQQAKTDWLLKRKNAKTYFETQNNGMISSCGYIENNCVDDCFRGITITSIEAL